MKHVILLLSILLVFGCVSSPIDLPILEDEHTPQETPKVCRNVTDLVPQVVEECGEVSYTEEECGKRKLEYNSSMNPISHLCWIDGDCGGKPLSTCTSCLKAATRCTLKLTNNDEKKSGTWTVGANFTQSNSLFSRDPVTKTIGPGETGVFDFQHFYDPGKPINSANCVLFVKTEAEVDDCIQITRTRQECTNVTTNVEVQRQVCE
jgi:hypothetical protein